MKALPHRMIDFATQRVTLGLALVALWFLSGCGKQDYAIVPGTVNINAPGSYAIPPKVDLLFAVDDTGSMHEAYPSISSQVPAFLGGLDAQNWDYRFATVPLVNKKFNRGIDQIIGSKYDPNWLTEWKPPYPGANPGLVDTIWPSFFRKFSNYTRHLSVSDIDNTLNGTEEAFKNIDNVLYNKAPLSGFLRPDAMLAIVVVGNGNDTSGVNYCRRSDGYWVPCNDGSDASSFAYYKSRFLNLKSSSSLVKFYAAVSSVDSASCLGGGATVGTRYKQMEQALTGAQNFNICSQSLTQVLSSMGSHLQAVRVNFRTRYLFIAQEPNVDTIEVVKYSNGQTTSIPQSATNGWTYAGYLTNTPAIDYPTPMNRTTGYAIELHGTAKLVGFDRADVTFRPRGL